jgi:hypothetical protein
VGAKEFHKEFCYFTYLKRGENNEGKKESNLNLSKQTSQIYILFYKIK